MTLAVPLAVPFEEKDRAKALGARWDPGSRTWYAPPGRDLTPFARWLRSTVAEAVGDLVRADVVAIPTVCWRCHLPIKALVGVLVCLAGRGAGLIWFDDVSTMLFQLDHAALAAQEAIGPVAFRRTRVRPDGYLANSCVGCGAVQGSFPLRQELDEYLSEGGDVLLLPVVATVDVPASALDETRLL